MRDARHRIQAEKDDYDLVDAAAYWIAWLVLCSPVYLTPYWWNALAGILVAGFVLFPFPFLWPIDIRILYRRFRYNYFVYEELRHVAGDATE